jgi:hypothetical protein
MKMSQPICQEGEFIKRFHPSSLYRFVTYRGSLDRRKMG